MMRIVILATVLLAACGPQRPNLLPRPMTVLEMEIGDIVRRGAGDTAEVSVAFLDLETGDSLLVEGHRVFHAASTMKVPVMLELFRRAERGELSLDDAVPVRNGFRSILDGSPYALSAADDSDTTLYRRLGERVAMRELIERMITRSSNLATNLLIDTADPKRIERTLAGINASGMKVLRGVEDGPAYRAGMNNTTTAYGFARVLAAVAGGRASSAASSREMVEILGRQEFTEMIPAGLPPGTRSANKTGSITRIAHDGAIVFPPGRAPYVLVVLTRGFSSPETAAPVGREISAAVWRRASAARRNR